MNKKVIKDNKEAFDHWFDKYVLENSLEHNTNESLGTLPTTLQK